MTDGPFKNLNLNRRWQRFVNAVQNKAVARSECASLASDALVREVLTNDTSALLRDLLQLSRQKQVDFDQASAVENIFNSHNKSVFSDTLQQHVLYHLDNGLSLNKTLGKSLDATVSTYIGGIIKSRLEEEILRAGNEREINRRECARALGMIGTRLAAINKADVCKALQARDRNAFRASVRRKSGLDDGPSL